MSQASSKLVSVIIPVYNGADYLAESIDSVLAQTCNDFELIVVDDGSTDDTSVIAQSYGPRLTYLYQENGGVAAALNHGIAQACGKYIAWLSHDDVFLPDKLEKQIAFLYNQPRFKACYTDFYVINSKGLTVSEVKTPWYPRKEAIRVLFGQMYINGSSILIERACFDKVGLFDERFRYSQDAEMWLRLSHYFEFGRVPETLIKYRSHPNQGSSRHAKAQDADKQAMYKHAFEALRRAGVLPELPVPADKPRTLAQIYEWFGDTMAFHRRWFDVADDQYRKAVELWPSWRNKARLKLTLGASRIFKIRRCHARIRRFLSARLRAVGLGS